VIQTEAYCCPCCLEITLQVMDGEETVHVFELTTSEASELELDLCEAIAEQENLSRRHLDHTSPSHKTGRNGGPFSFPAIAY
jgi:hypothetical protein